MRERLLGQPNESVPKAMDREEIMDRRQNMESNQVGTVVKVGAIARRCISFLQVELSAFNPYMYLSEHFNTSTLKIVKKFGNYTTEPTK